MPLGVGYRRSPHPHLRLGDDRRFGACRERAVQHHGPGEDITTRSSTRGSTASRPRAQYSAASQAFGTHGSARAPETQPPPSAPPYSRPARAKTWAEAEAEAGDLANSPAKHGSAPSLRRAARIQ